MKITNKINKNIFRAYDVRGVYGEDIDQNFAYTFGRAYGSYIKKFNQKKCITARDNRLSSPLLQNALNKGILDSGIDIIDLKMVTTPMFYYAKEYYDIPAGVMVTASHNPKEDNGFKFSFDDRGNARGEMIQEFLDFMLKGEFDTGIGIKEEKEILPDYIELFKNNILPLNRRVKVVLDPGNGTTANFLDPIFREFNIDYVIINEESDGNFPNHHPDPCVEDNLLMLKQAVKDFDADLGIAFDGDGDRFGVVDEKGNFIECDILMAIIIKSLIGKVAKNEFLADVKCSKALLDYAESLGAKIMMSRTGNSYTKASVIDNNLPFGGELSGHVYFNDRFNAFDSGIYAALRLIEILASSDVKMSDYLKGIPKYYSTPEIKIPSTDELKVEVVDKIIDYARSKGYDAITLDGIRVNFDDGWALVRYSNTGPNITARFEAKNEEVLDRIQKEFLSLIEEYNK